MISCLTSFRTCNCPQYGLFCRYYPLAWCATGHICCHLLSGRLLAIRQAEDSSSSNCFSSYFDLDWIDDDSLLWEQYSSLHWIVLWLRWLVSISQTVQGHSSWQTQSREYSFNSGLSGKQHSNAIQTFCRLSSTDCLWVRSILIFHDYGEDCWRETSIRHPLLIESQWCFSIHATFTDMS